ncbi:hypothetical protein C8R44DRAFT_729693 [Mycena epipterygia]|nr:hypothetical protein C8R44DRAFT_729693 [Mycena epipterygia]
MAREGDETSEGQVCVNKVFWFFKCCCKSGRQGGGSAKGSQSVAGAKAQWGGKQQETEKGQVQKMLLNGEMPHQGGQWWEMEKMERKLRQGQNELQGSRPKSRCAANWVPEFAEKVVAQILLWPWPYPWGSDEEKWLWWCTGWRAHKLPQYVRVDNDWPLPKSRQMDFMLGMLEPRSGTIALHPSTELELDWDKGICQRQMQAALSHPEIWTAFTIRSYNGSLSRANDTLEILQTLCIWGSSQGDSKEGPGIPHGLLAPTEMLLHNVVEPEVDFNLPWINIGLATNSPVGRLLFYRERRPMENPEVWVEVLKEFLLYTKPEGNRRDPVEVRNRKRSGVRNRAGGECRLFSQAPQLGRVCDHWTAKPGRNGKVPLPEIGRMMIGSKMIYEP